MVNHSMDFFILIIITLSLLLFYLFKIIKYIKITRKHNAETHVRGIPNHTIGTPTSSRSIAAIKAILQKPETHKKEIIFGVAIE
jgi:hypothetical protein